jgi:hypothetical protein
MIYAMPAVLKIRNAPPIASTTIAVTTIAVTITALSTGLPIFTRTYKYESTKIETNKAIGTITYKLLAGFEQN